MRFSQGAAEDAEDVVRSDAMFDALQSYQKRHWAFRQQLLDSSHRDLAFAPEQPGYVAFFGGSNLFAPYSMDRQLQQILRNAGCREVVLNLGSFGFCDSRYVVDTTRSLLRCWRGRRPALLIYEVNPNEMPPVEGEVAEVFVRKPWRGQAVLSYDDGWQMASALASVPIALPRRLVELSRVATREGFPVVLLDFESNIRDWAPTFSAFTREVGTADAARFRVELDGAMSDLTHGRYDSATARLDTCRAIDPDVAILRFLLGRLAERRGDLAEASVHLRFARSADLVRGRTLGGIAGPDLARLCSELGFGFVSVPSLVADMCGARPPGFDVFFDEVHYRPHIHLRIAGAVATVIQQRGMLSLTRGPVPMPSEPVNSRVHMPFVLVQNALDLLLFPPPPYDDGRIAHGRSLLSEAAAKGLDPKVASQAAARFQLILRQRSTPEQVAPATTPGSGARREPDLLNALRDTLRHRHGVEVTDADLETDLRALGLDSLALLDLTVDVLEGAAGLSLPSADLTIDNVVTIGAILRLARDVRDDRAAHDLHGRAVEFHRIRRDWVAPATASPGRPASLRGFPPERFADRSLAGVIEEVLTCRAGEDALAFLPAGVSNVEGGSIRLTRAALEEASRRAASGLSSLGVGAGDTVLLMAGHRLETVLCFVAALRMGAVPCILHTPSQKMSHAVFLETFGQIARRSGARVVLTTPEARSFVSGQLTNGVTVIDVEEVSGAEDRGRSWSPRGNPIEPGGVALVQHSSGTTGVKKGIELSHRAVLLQATHYAAAIDLRDDDRVVSWLPLYHDMGLIACLVMPLVAGVPTFLISPFDWVVAPDLLLRAITCDRSTLAWMPNFAFHFMADRVRLDPNRRIDLSSVRALINCAEPIDAASWQRLHHRLGAAGLTRCAYGTSYAMAENVFAVTQAGINAPVPVDYVGADRLRSEGVAEPVLDPEVPTVAIPSSGRPIAGTVVRTVDGEGRTLPERVVGEIVIGGDCVAHGYRGTPGAGQSAFAPDGYHTGDLGYLADGWLYVLGRRSDVIIVAGQNLYPTDVETAVGRVDGVRPGRVVAFGVDDAMLGTQRLVVLAEADASVEDRPAELARLRASIAQAVYDLLSIGVSTVLLLPQDTLRKSSSGKLSRDLNRQLYLRGDFPRLNYR